MVGVGRPLSWRLSWQVSVRRQLVLAPVDKGLARLRVLLQAVPGAAQPST